MAGCRWAGRVFAISSSLRRGPLGLEGSASREAGTFRAAGHQRAHPPGFPCGSSPAAGARGRGLPEEAEEDELVGASSDDSEVGVSHGLVTTKLDVVMAPRLNVEIRGRVLKFRKQRLCRRRVPVTLRSVPHRAPSPSTRPQMPAGRPPASFPASRGLGTGARPAGAGTQAGWRAVLRRFLRASSTEELLTVQPGQRPPLATGGPVSQPAGPARRLRGTLTTARGHERRAPWAFPSSSAHRLQHTLSHRPPRPAPEEPPQPLCDRTRIRALTRVETHAHAVCTHATRTHTPRVRGRPEGPDSPGENAAHPAKCGFRVNSRSC